jgi:site-specific recombinase XerD
VAVPPTSSTTTFRFNLARKKMARSFIKLTRARLRALQPGERRTEQGITFERLANGDGLFSVNVMVDRERIHRNLGRESEGVTRTTAEKFIAKVRQDAREGRLDFPKRRKVPLTLATAALLYLDRLDQEGGKEIERKRQRLEQCLVPFLGKVQMGQITSFDIEKHRLAQSIQSRKKLQPGQTSPTNRPATVNRELATLSHLLNKAVEWGWIERPPAKIRKLKEDNGRIVFLTAAQAESLLEAAKADQNRQIRVANRNAQVGDPDHSARKHRSRCAFDSQAKAGARTQPISADLASFLADYLETLPKGTPWLFPSIGALHGHTVDVRKAFVRAVTSAGLDPKQVVRHTLRHTAITHLVQAGVDLPTVKRISGHKTMAMVERYAHQSGAHIADAMEKLDGRYRLKKK